MGLGMCPSHHIRVYVVRADTRRSFGCQPRKVKLMKKVQKIMSK